MRRQVVPPPLHQTDLPPAISFGGFWVLIATIISAFLRVAMITSKDKNTGRHIHDRWFNRKD
jgi:hypothetical protein